MAPCCPALHKVLMPIVVAGWCKLKPALKPPGFSASKVKYDEVLISFAFNLNLRPYTVAVEKIIQNSLGAVGAPPMSLASITALEKALERDFVAAGGTWEGVERVVREEELVVRGRATAAAAAASGLMATELQHGMGLNPVRWLAHAVRRAPTAADHEHHLRCAAMTLPVEQDQQVDGGMLPPAPSSSPSTSGQKVAAALGSMAALPGKLAAAPLRSLMHRGMSGDGRLKRSEPARPHAGLRGMFLAPFTVFTPVKGKGRGQGPGRSLSQRGVDDDTDISKKAK